MSWLSTRRAIDVPCTIEVEHTFDSLHAHVDLDGDVEIEPGDEVQVHGEPIRVPFGETRRPAPHRDRHQGRRSSSAGGRA